MKIGVDALFMIPGEVGGAETCLRKTLASMARLFSDDEFIIFGNAENRTAITADLADCPNATLINMNVRATSRPRRILKEQLALPRLLSYYSVDAVWCPGNLAPLRARCPVISTIYDMQYMHFPEDYTKASLAAMRFFTRKTLEKSNVVVTPSEFSRREISSLTGTQFDKIAVTSCGVSETFAKPLSGPFLADRIMAVIGRGSPYILCVANTYPHKHVNDVVTAFGKIAGEIPHRLVLVGQPRLGEAAVLEAISALKEPSRVDRIYRVSDPDMVALTQGAGALALASHYEGFGLPVLEAMSAGTPVVACRAGSVPEVGGDTIRYAEPGDTDDFARQLHEIVTLSASERESISARARERAGHFSWDNTARLTFDAIRRAI